jgi:hypothetical protein
VTSAVHAEGGKIAMQILHAGRYAYHPLAVSFVLLPACLSDSCVSRRLPLPEFNLRFPRSRLSRCLLGLSNRLLMISRAARNWPKMRATMVLRYIPSCYMLWDVRWFCVASYIAAFIDIARLGNGQRRLPHQRILELQNQQASG